MFRLQGGDWVAREIVGTFNPAAPSSLSVAVMSFGGVTGARRHREPLLEARERYHAETIAAARQKDADAGWRAAGSSGSAITKYGAIQNRGVAVRRTLSEEARCLRQRTSFTSSTIRESVSSSYGPGVHYRSPSLWDGDRPKYAQQMKQIQDWLDEAKAKGIKKAFITFHYPVFCRVGPGPHPRA